VTLTLAAHGSTATGSAQSYTSANVSVTAGEIYLVTVHIGVEDSTVPATLSSLTLAGLTGTEQGHVPYDIAAGIFRNRGYTYSFAATATTAGPLIVTLSASQLRVVWTITRCSSSIGFPKIIQSVTAQASAQTASATLAAFANTANINYSSLFWQQGTSTNTVEAGASKIHDTIAANQNYTTTAQKTNDTVLQHGLAAAGTHGVVAIEVGESSALSLGGSITPTGTLARLTSKTLAGAVTPTGTLANLVTRVVLLAGSITPTGTLAKTVTKTLAGSITPTGSLVVTLLKQFLYPLFGGALDLVVRAADALHLTSRETDPLTLTPGATDDLNASPQSEDTLHLDPLEEDDR
jgi:hypothetical protein